MQKMQIIENFMPENIQLIQAMVCNNIVQQLLYWQKIKCAFFGGGGGGGKIMQHDKKINIK